MNSNYALTVANWPVSRVCCWVESLDRGEFVKYSRLFRKHDICGHVLPDLDSDLLLEMGIHPLGDRMRLLSRIRSLAASDATELPPPLKFSLSAVDSVNMQRASGDTANAVRRSRMNPELKISTTTLHNSSSSVDQRYSTTSKSRLHSANDSSDFDTQTTITPSQGNFNHRPVSCAPVMNKQRPSNATTAAIKPYGLLNNIFLTQISPSRSTGTPGGSSGYGTARVEFLTDLESVHGSTRATPSPTSAFQTTPSSVSKQGISVRPPRFSSILDTVLTVGRKYTISQHQQQPKSADSQKSSTIKQISPISPASEYSFSSQPSEILEYDHVKRRCIRVFDENGSWHIINVSDLASPSEIMQRILLKLHLIDQDNEEKDVSLEYALYVPEDLPQDDRNSALVQQCRPLMDEEIWQICKSNLPPHPFKHNLYLCRRRRLSTIDVLTPPSTPPPPPPLTTTIIPPDFTAIMATKLNENKSRSSVVHDRPPSDVVSLNIDCFFPTYSKETNETLATMASTSITQGSLLRSTIEERRLMDLRRIKTLRYLTRKRLSMAVQTKPRSQTCNALGLVLQMDSTEFCIQSGIESSVSSLSQLQALDIAICDGYELEGENQWKQNDEHSQFLDKQPACALSPPQSILIPVVEEEGDEEFVKSVTTEGIEPEETQEKSFTDGLQNWIKGDLIGRGSFAQVYYGINSVTGDLMAVKQVDLPQKPSHLDGNSGKDEQVQMRYYTKNFGNSDKPGSERRRERMLEALRGEIDLLKTLHHENIVQYLGSTMNNQHLDVFLEYISGGSIASIIRKQGPIHVDQIRKYVPQILCGLDYLHSRSIIHRDIKGANILVTERHQIKISDFGVSKLVDSLTQHGTKRFSMQGSIFWMAPEVIRVKNQYTFSADIWSFGCLLLEMLSGEHPWSCYDGIQALYKIGMGESTPWIYYQEQQQQQQQSEFDSGGNPDTDLMEYQLDIPKDLRQILDSCLVIEPHLRPSAREILDSWVFILQ